MGGPYQITRVSSAKVADAAASSWRLARHAWSLPADVRARKAPSVNSSGPTVVAASKRAATPAEKPSGR